MIKTIKIDIMLPTQEPSNDENNKNQSNTG